MSLTLNGISVGAMRWRAPWSGVWTADVDLIDPAALPSGRAVVVGETGIALVGTVLKADAFGEQSFARILGGGGGWGKAVRPQHFTSALGVPISVLASTTATEVGETAVVLAPQTVGPDFVRRAAPAAQIFTDAGVDWWVGLDGVTRIGVRPPVVAPTSLKVLDWDAAAGTVSFTADVLIEPGTVIVDERFGRRIVREVEATVSGASVTGTLWTKLDAAAAGTISKLFNDLAAISCQATRIENARFYEYGVIAMAGDRVQLRAVSPSSGMPDILPASIWAGISGYKAALRPGSSVLVGFIDGSPKRPYVAAYEPPENDGWRPLTLDFDASLLITIGGDTATGVATMQSQAQLMAGIAALCVALQPFANFPTISGLSGGTSAAVAAAAATLGALTALPTNYSLKVRAA